MIHHLYFTLFSCLIAFILGLVPKSKYGLFFIIFLIPFSGKSLSIGYFTSSFLTPTILAFSLGYFAKKGKIIFTNLYLVRYKANILLILVCHCISIFALIFNDVPRNVSFFGDDVFQAVINYTSSIVAGIILYMLILFEVKAYEDLLFFLKTFIVTLFFLSLVVFFSSYMHVPLPNIIKPISYTLVHYKTEITSLQTDLTKQSNFAGFHGYMENFAEYLFIIFSFGFILIDNKKRNNIVFGVFCIILTLIFSVFAAIKAYPFMIIYFIILYFILCKNSKMCLKVLLIMFLLIIGVISFNDFLKNTWFFSRIMELNSRYSSTCNSNSIFERIVVFLGREDLIPMFPHIIAAGGLFGLGPFIIVSLRNSVIPFHNLYYQIYLNYGLMGFIIFMCFFIRILVSLVKARAVANPKLFPIINGFISLFIVLLLEQMKVSSFRLHSGIFTFWFLFGLFSSVVNLVDSVKYKNISREENIFYITTN